MASDAPVRGGIRRKALAVLVCAVPIALTAAPAAGAAVTITPSRTVVTGAGGKVVVNRSPFRLSFVTRSGRRVLTQAGAPRRMTLPSTLDPEPFYLERRPDRAFYAPFGFLVGKETRRQWFGSYWAGNMLLAERQGTWNSARRVIAARRAGRGLRATLSTTDPSGRRLLLRVAPVGRSFAVSVRPSSSRGVVGFADSFRTASREAFHGLGGRHWGVDLRGKTLPSWIEQENFGGPSYTTAVAILPPFLKEGTGNTLEQLGGFDIAARYGGDENYMFPGGPGATYGSNTHLVSSRGYGLTLDRPEYARWRLGSTRGDAWQVDVSSNRLSYRVNMGATARVIAAQSKRTGRHLLPPAWAHGPTLWRLFKVNGTETRETYAAAIRKDLDDIARLRPPLKAYAFESWAILDPTFVRQVITRLRSYGIRSILYVRAYYANDVLATQPAADVDAVRTKGYAVRDANGGPAFFGVPGSPNAAMLLDFTNPRAVAFWNRGLQKMLDLGGDGFMQDFGEATLEGMRFHNGETGRTMHNRYPIYYHRATRRFLDRYERRHPGRGKIYQMTRAGFTGSARYEISNFPGDETTNWERASGLRSLAPDMLNRAVGGSFGFTTDIGGYSDLLDGPPNDELFTRWSEWSALTPFFRVHNSANAGTRRPWDFSPDTYRRWLDLAALHNRATPLLRRLWREGRKTGMPPTRPLWLAYPRDRRAAAEDQEWLLGPDVLVAPVVQKGATSRAVYFPRGCWARPDGSLRVRGPRTVTVPAPIGRLPYFFRCGKRPF